MNKRLLLIPAAVVAAVLAWTAARRQEFLYAGTVEAIEVGLSPRVSSSIAAVGVHEGDRVKTGQLLVELGCEDYKLAADIAARDSERAGKLFKQGSMPREEYDRLTNRSDDAKLKVEWCQVKSPLDGTVLERLHEPGEWAAPGTKLLTLADLQAVYAYVYVPQPMLAGLSLGQEVEAFLPELGMKPVKGRIEHIRSEAEFTPKNVQTREERTRLVFGVKVALDNKEELLKPGMPVEVRLGR
jgi:HlyD family secretion protein